MIPSIGIVPAALHLLRRNQNVFPVFPALCVDPAIDISDVGRIAVGVVAATQRRIIGHTPGRVELSCNAMSWGGWVRLARPCSCWCDVASCAGAWGGTPQLAESQSTQAHNRGLHRTFNMPAPCPKLPSARNSRSDLRFCVQATRNRHNQRLSASRRSWKRSTHLIEHRAVRQR